MEAKPPSITAKFKLLILCVWIGQVVSSSPAFCQQPIHYVINTEDGLPSNEVYDLIEDRFGFIWLGCEKGIYRYDGVRFKEYPIRHDLNQAIIALSLDRFGRIWGKNAAGQVFLNVADSMRPVFLGTNSKSSRSALATDGCFYTLQGTSIQRRGTGGQILQDFHLNWVRDSLVSIGFFDVIGSNAFAHLGPEGLIHTDLRGAQSVLLDEPLTHPDQNRVIGMNLHGDIPLFLLPAKGANPGCLFKWSDQRLEKIMEIPVETAPVRWLRILPEKNGDVWLCSSRGAVKTTPGKPWNLGDFMLPDCQVSGLLQDREGNTWLTTLNKGLVVVPSLLAEEVAMLPASGIHEHFTAIHSLNDGSILAGTYTGSLWIARSGKPFIPVLEKQLGRVGAVKRIYEHEGRVFVLRNELAVSLDGAKTFQHTGHFNARDITFSGSELLLIADYGLIAVQFMEGKQLDDLHYLSNSGGNAICKERDGSVVYVGFNERLSMLKDGKLHDILLDGRNVVVAEMSATGEGVWMATWGHGLICLRNGKVVKRFAQRDGLPEGRLLGVAAAGRHVYFRSEKNLGKVDAGSGLIELISHGTGFNPGDVKKFCVVGDKLFLATGQGIASVPTDFGTYSAYKPRVRIDAMKLGTKYFAANSIPQVPYGQPIQIDFSGLHFRSRGGLKYKYRLLDVDTNWIETGAAANYAIWNALPPGHFRFEVKALGTLGEESEQVANMDFVVLRPFYLQAWFLILSALSLIGLTILVFRVALLRVRKRAAIQNALISSQLTALKAQMNPHFLFNSLNSIQHLILQQDIPNSNLYLNKFSNLVRKVLDASGHDWIELEAEVEILRLYLELEKLRFGNDFKFEIHVIHPDESGHVRIPSMVIQPFVENAVKHGLLHKKGEKFLKIVFDAQETLKCAIEDNGIGRQRSAEINARRNKGHESFSTYATRRRLDLIRELHHTVVGLEIIDLGTSDNPKGTRVELTLPCREN